MRLKWSKYFQTPDFLERTRLMLVMPEYEPLIAAWCGLKDGARVLDVGCGTGFLARMLKRVNSNARVTGLDVEEVFLERARKEAAAEGLAIDFVQGDAMSLPFPDGSFDIVVSHTFLSSAQEPGKVFAEMKRVLVPGGCIGSITAMNFLPSVIYEGAYPEEGHNKELLQLTEELWQVYQKLSPLSRYAGGISLKEMPRFFVSQGMKDVSAYPLGKLFSLSNAAIPREQKLKWLELYPKSEEDKLEAFMEFPEMQELFSRAKADRYKELVREKCAYYLERPEENSVWEYVGGANLLVTGRL